MAVSQQVNLKIKGDASQALQQISRVKKEAISMQGQLQTKSGLILPNFGETAKAAQSLGILTKESKKLAPTLKKAKEEAIQLRTASGALGKALSGVNNMSRSTTFAIGNTWQTFSLARQGGHAMNFVLNQVMDSFMLLGPAGIAVGAVAAGLGVVSRAFKQTEKSEAELAKETKKFNKEMAKDVKQLTETFGEIPPVIERVARQFKIKMGPALEDMAKVFQQNRLDKTVESLNQQLLQFGKTDAEKSAMDASAAYFEMATAVTKARGEIPGLISQINGVVSEIDRLNELDKKGLAAKGRIAEKEALLAALKKELAQATIIARTSQDEIARQKELAQQVKFKAKELEALQKAEERREEALERQAEKQKQLFADIKAAGREILETENQIIRFSKVLTEEELQALQDKIIAKEDMLAAHIASGGQARQEAEAALAVLDSERLDREMAERLARENALEREKLKIRKKAAKAEVKLNKSKNDEKEQQDKESEDRRKAQIEAATSFVVNLTEDAAKIAVSTEKNKGEAITKLFLEATGKQLVAMGTKAFVEGGIILATSVGADPRGYALVAKGTAAIAAGIGMGAAGGALGSHMSMQREQQRENERDRKREDGVSRRRSSTFGGTSKEDSAPTVINIQYGIGPQPEQTAQAVLDAMAFGARRGMRGRA